MDVMFSVYIVGCGAVGARVWKCMGCKMFQRFHPSVVELAVL